MPLSPGLPALLSLGELKIEPVALRPEPRAPGLRPFVLEDHLRAGERQVAAARAGVERARKQLAELEEKAQAAAESGPVEKSGAPAKLLSVENGRLDVALAEKTFAAAEIQPALLRARAAADRARFDQPPASYATELARGAALPARGTR